MVLKPRSSFITAFFFLQILGSLVLCSPLSNGQRIALGLPPKPPKKFGRLLPGFSPVDVPTRVREIRSQVSPSSAPSGKPLKSFTGKLQVRTDNGTIVGYLQKAYDSIGTSIIIDTTSAPSNVVEVKHTPNSKTKPSSLEITSSLFGAPVSFIGAFSNVSKMASLNATNGTMITLASVEESSGIGVPAYSSTLKGYAESAIWTIDPITKELTSQYTNPDESQTAMFLVRDNVTNIIVFTNQNMSPEMVHLFIV